MCLVVLSFVGCIEQVRPTHILTTHKHWDHAGTAHTGTDQARPSAATLRYVFTLHHCCGLRRSLCPSARALRPQLGTVGTRGIVGRALRRFSCAAPPTAGSVRSAGAVRRPWQAAMPSFAAGTPQSRQRLSALTGPSPTPRRPHARVPRSEPSVGRCASRARCGAAALGLGRR